MLARSNLDTPCISCGHPASSHGAIHELPESDLTTRIASVLQMEKMWSYCYKMPAGPEKQKWLSRVTTFRNQLKLSAMPRPASARPSAAAQKQQKRAAAGGGSGTAPGGKGGCDIGGGEGGRHASELQSCALVQIVPTAAKRAAWVTALLQEDMLLPPANMLVMLVTWLTSHASRGWLNAPAP